MNASGKKRDGYQFSAAGPDDNNDILNLLRKSPIRMEMDYIMDRQGDFFRAHQLLPGSRVLLARDEATGNLEGFLSLLKFEGRLAGETAPFQYVTDLIKSGENRNPLLMKRLLNYGFEHYFDTNFIFGLINARNSPARLFSRSTHLQYPGTHIQTFHYVEMAPLWHLPVARHYTVRPAANEIEIAEALHFINNYYQNHALFLPLTPDRLAQELTVLPGFSRDDIQLLYENEQLAGAMITYRPAALSSLIVTRIDKWSRLLFNFIRGINRLTGWLFDPPKEGGHINSLQVRYLAGNNTARKALLNAANNIACREKLHSVSMLLDARDALQPGSLVTYRYQSYMYANGKQDFEKITNSLQNQLIFFDIVFS